MSCAGIEPRGRSEYSEKARAYPGEKSMPAKQNDERSTFHIEIPLGTPPRLYILQLMTHNLVQVMTHNLCAPPQDQAARQIGLLREGARVPR